MILAFYLSGIGTATFALAGLYFLKFWKVSRDQFFLCLSFACWLLALERLAGLVTYLTLPTDDASMDSIRSWIYLFRLLAFIVIIISVVGKNRAVVGKNRKRERRG